MDAEARPAFYALERGGWRDYVTLLHLPYTAWHLSYVAIGCALAPTLHADRLLAALAGFALALGIAAHALDELRGRPLGTEIPRGVLIGLALVSLLGAVAIGIASALAWTPWLLPFVALGPFLVPAYNLELLGGRLHTDLGFALAWGAFPVVTAFVAQTGTIRAETALAAAWATALSLAQRHLSTHVRRLRREVVAGELTLRDGRTIPLEDGELRAAPERGLQLLAAATVTLAAALVALRL